MKFRCLLILLSVALVPPFCNNQQCGYFDQNRGRGIYGDVYGDGELCGWTRRDGFHGEKKSGFDEIDEYLSQYDNFGSRDMEEMDKYFDLNAKLGVWGKLMGFGNEARGRSYEEVSVFRRGGGTTKCGGKRKHYNKIDTYGKGRRYEEKNWKSDVVLGGKVKAGGNYDLTGRREHSDLYADFDSSNQRDKCATNKCAEESKQVGAVGEGRLAGAVKMDGGISYGEGYGRKVDRGHTHYDPCYGCAEYGY